MTVEEAQRRIVERVRRLDPERVPIERAFGRVLADMVSARTDLPPFPSSAMDGFAVRASDTAGAPVTLAVAGQAAAGRPSGVVLEPGQAIEISTGDTASAKRALERAVELEPANPETWRQLGRLRLDQLNDPRAALRAFQYAYYLDPYGAQSINDVVVTARIVAGMP